MLTKYMRRKTNTTRVLQKLANKTWVKILCKTQNEITHMEIEREREGNTLQLS